MAGEFDEEIRAALRKQRIGTDNEQEENDARDANPGIAGSNNLKRDFKAIYSKDARSERAIDGSAATARVVAQRRERKQARND